MDDHELLHILKNIGRPEPATMLREPFGGEESWWEIAATSWRRFEIDKNEKEKKQ